MVQPLGQPVEPEGTRWRRALRSEPVGDSAIARDLGKACACGHGKRAHEHYRAGSDCSFCSCSGFHRPLLVRLRLRGS